jgi:hypothetical protein
VLPLYVTVSYTSTLEHLRGGFPPMTFFALDVPGGGTAVNKSGYSATLICGSTASGDPLPVHFQLKTLAQTVDVGG